MIQERKWMVVNRKSSLRCRDAADERQYMLSGDYEVYDLYYRGGIFFPDRGPGGADAEGRFPVDR